MQYLSLGQQAPRVSFDTAVIQGLAPDRGLYFPNHIQSLEASFFDAMPQMDRVDLAYKVMEQFVGNTLSKNVLCGILSDVLSFDFPLVQLSDQVAVLELFHGPTMAFKDVGARFMARCLEHFNRDATQPVTVLVATSGDTGGAVARGFLGVQGIEVIILYPKGKVSEVQERQLTTLGQNIRALRVDGTFDDCQEMVKTAFLDREITHDKVLTSANSINVARWLPQMLYYFFAVQQISQTGDQHVKFTDQKRLVFSVPSGNFGNICAGVVAQRLGLPIDHFVAATNANDSVARYLDTERYEPRPSISTISNAMDVGNPSNFVRIQELYEQQFEHLKSNFSSCSFDDDTTRSAMKRLYDQYGYISDPHGAVGYLGLEKQVNQKHTFGIFLETAHPAKFSDIVQNTLGIDVALPKQLNALMDRTKKFESITSYAMLKSILRSS